MSTEAPDRIWSGIDIAKTVAGALAAVCAAVAGSFLGVAGTLIGAAIASIIGSVGTEIYARSLKRGAEKLHTIAPVFVKAPAAVGTPPVEAASEAEAPSHTVPAEPKRQLRWRRIAVITGVLFVLAMGAITAVELFAGRSVASMFGHDSSGGTTISSVTSGSRRNDQPATTPSETPSEQSTAPEQAPASEPAETPAATEPTTTPSTGPTTDAPAPADQQQDPATGNEPDQPEDGNPQPPAE